MKVLQIARRVSKLFQKRQRRMVVGARRAHVELRDLADEELEPLVEALQALTRPLGAMQWAQVNLHTRRIVFAYQEHAFNDLELEALVDQAESQARISAAKFATRDVHPVDTEPSMQLLVELCVDVAATIAGFGLRISPLPAVPFSGNAVALLSLVKNTQRLRQGLDARLGTERADFALNLLTSALHVAAHRPMSSLVDVTHKYSRLRELESTREVWRKREAELCAESQGPVVGARQHLPRPCPMPPGAIEEYAERAWAVSLAGFGLSFLTTRSFQRATAALFGGLPHPARIGREVFASELGRQLGWRGVLVRDADALRRLDRIDCLVVQGDLVSRHRFVIGGVLTEDPEEAAAARARARDMFDSEHPLRERSDGLWVLRPWARSRANMDIHLQERARDRLATGALLLSLERADRVVAVVEIEIIARTGAEELIAAAHEANLRVVVVTADEGVLDQLNADDVISPQEGTRAGIRRLQREGRTVALVATGDSDGLPLADVSIGLTRRGEPTPWGASLICHNTLEDVQFIIHASRRARRLSKQAVNIALAAASMGALVSAGGLLRLTSRRVVFVVNTASLVSMANGYRHAAELQQLMLPPPRDPTPWHALDAEGVMTRLGSSLAGLTRNEVVRRAPERTRQRTALSELTETISEELFNPLAPLLAAGAGLSAVVGSVADASMVASAVVVNAMVGGAQRFRTERKIRDFSKTEPLRARVKRDNQDYVVDASDLVLGDLVVLSTGDVVPADCRIVDAYSLEVDTSSLTGESLPVHKGVAPSFELAVADHESMLYEGTSIAAGRASAVVVATGNATEARRGASTTKRGRAQGGVEQRLKGLMDLTGPIALVAGIGVVGGGLLRGRKMEELVGSGVSLAVASVPEGLPLLATAAQLAAAQRLSTRGALIRNVRAIEALGRVDVICLDKTGTLTEGRIDLTYISDGETQEPLNGLVRVPRAILAAALRASPDPEIFPDHDPTDDALYRAAASFAMRPNFGLKHWMPRSELSFEAGRSYHATLGRIDDDHHQLSIKGAPEAVLPLCSTWQREGNSEPLTEGARLRLAEEVARLGRRGLRVLAVAERALSEDLGVLAPEKLKNLEFMGFLVFTDPIRPTAKVAVASLLRAGVRTVMVTGDHPSTAQAIAAELEFTARSRTLSGAQLADLDDHELDALVGEIAVFARITPAQKVRIVRSLQRVGKVVAMVGDGANDAPAIRLADVGVAVGEHSTAAARSAADVVLTDGKIETLGAAIAEGRAMWARVRDAVSILLGGNFGEIGFTTLVGLISGRPPLSARQLLLVNLLTDVAPAMAIALRPPTQETLDQLSLAGPETTLGKPLTREIALRAALTSVGAGGAWTVARLTGGRDRARTIALAALVGTQLAQTLRSGQGSRGVIATGAASAALLALIIQTPGVSHFFGCTPLGPVGWATAIGASAAAANLPRLSATLAEWVGEQPVTAEQIVPRAASQLSPANDSGVARKDATPTESVS